MLLLLGGHPVSNLNKLLAESEQTWFTKLDLGGISPCSLFVCRHGGRVCFCLPRKVKGLWGFKSV